MDLLLIDYDTRCLRAFQDVFEMWGFRVTTCSQGSELHQLLGEHSFDAVITELELPDTHRTDLIPMLRNKLPDSPLIILTENHSVQSAIFAMKNGADDFIQKPFEVEKLKELLLRALSYRKAEGDDHLDWQLEYHANALSTSIEQVIAKMQKTRNDLRFWETLQLTSFELVSDAVLMLTEDEQIVIINKKMRQLLWAQDKTMECSRLFHDYPQLQSTVLYSIFSENLCEPKNQEYHNLDFHRPFDDRHFRLDLKVVPVRTSAEIPLFVGLIFVINRVTQPKGNDRHAENNKKRQRGMK